MKRLKTLIACTVVAYAAMMAAPASPALADATYCGPGIQSGGAYAAPSNETCTTVYTAGSTSYLHIGNAEYFVGMQYLSGTADSMQNWSRARLVPAGQFINMFWSPTVGTYRISNTQVQVEEHWDRPDNRTHCWWFATVSGSDNNHAVTSAPVGNCGPF